MLELLPCKEVQRGACLKDGQGNRGYEAWDFVIEVRIHHKHKVIVRSMLILSLPVDLFDKEFIMIIFEIPSEYKALHDFGIWIKSPLENLA